MTIPGGLSLWFCVALTLTGTPRVMIDSQRVPSGIGQLIIATLFSLLVSGLLLLLVPRFETGDSGIVFLVSTSRPISGSLQGVTILVSDLSNFQQKVKQSLELDPTPGIQMLVTREGVDAEDLRHYALVKFFSEGDDTLKLFNADTLLSMVKTMNSATSSHEKIMTFELVREFLNWVVYPIEHELEEMLWRTDTRDEHA